MCDNQSQFPCIINHLNLCTHCISNAVLLAQLSLNVLVLAWVLLLRTENWPSLLWGLSSYINRTSSCWNTLQIKSTEYYYKSHSNYLLHSRERCDWMISPLEGTLCLGCIWCYMEHDHFTSCVCGEGIFHSLSHTVVSLGENMSIFTSIMGLKWYQETIN